MWWSIKKTEETDAEVVYSYGYESAVLTGSFAIAKNFSLINIFEYAKNDDKEIFTELFRQPLIAILKRNGFVEEHQFAIG